MEHIRPGNKLSQGYFCTICGDVTNMYGTGHGPDKCKPNPKLVKELKQLNRSSKEKEDG